MRARRTAVVLAAVMVTACHSPTPSSPTTGLTGFVVRGPVVPVCQVNVSCNAPFSATFTIERSGKLVAQFRSGNDGSFTVWLDPGDYRVTPAADAPLIAPGSQTRQVEVGTIGLTTVRLEFDTGIR